MSPAGKAPYLLAALAVCVTLPLSTARAEGDTRLAEAASRRDSAAVRALIGEKVDVNAPGRDGTPALHWLVWANDLEAAQLLIHAGADATRPDRYGVTPLSLASSNGNVDLIRLLLDAGADPNSAGPAGETVLMSAVRSGSLDAVNLLLDRGATLDARDAEFQQT